MRHLFLVWLALLFLFSGTALAQDQHAVAGLRNLQGSAWVERDGATIPAVNGMELFIKDQLRTGDDGRVGLIFKDDTRLSLGPGSQVTIEDFVFEPAQQRFAFLARLARGTAAFLTGQMSKLSPESMSVETPRASIGIRGTHFLVQVEE